MIKPLLSLKYCELIENLIICVNVVMNLRTFSKIFENEIQLINLF